MAFCPAHDDGRKHGGRSLSLHPEKGVHCFAGCTFTEIMSAFGVPLKGRAEPIPLPEAAPSDLGTPVIYQYKDGNGRLIAEKGRFETRNGKTFRFRVPSSGSGEWGALGFEESELPLFGAHLVTQAAEQPIIYVEGEKAAAACHEHKLLAVTHAGGASQQDFGIALEVLRDRDVWLWPDNDPPGQRCMHTVGARLKLIARSVHEIDVPLPYKGDAFDFFASGGTAQQVIDGVRDRESTEWVAHDAITVKLPTEDGRAVFAFSDIEYRSALQFELAVSVEGQPYNFEKHINLGSQSAETDFRRSLEAVFGKLEWARMLNKAFTEVKRAYQQLPRAMHPWDIAEVTEQKYLIDSILPEGLPTIIFADGGKGKSFIALRMALAVAMGESFCGMAVRQTSVLYMDWEDIDTTFRFRLWRIYKGLGYEDVGPYAVDYWNARGVPLAEQIREVRRYVEENGIGLVIIDAAAAACGGEPEKSETALRFFNALSKLGSGVTTLILAHVTKVEGERDSAVKPSGSGHWSHEARRTWFMRTTNNEGSDDIYMTATCQKSNGPRPSPMTFHIHFSGDSGPISVEAADARTVPELQGARALKWRIADVLYEPMAVKEIAELLGETVATVRATLAANRGVMFASEGSKSGGRGNQVKWTKITHAVP